MENGTVFAAMVLRRAYLVAVGLTLLASPAWAVPMVDGTKDAEYGAALAVQTVDTTFGDNLSEMDAAYAVCDGSKLYLMLTGNIQANFNSLEIFIDSKVGGQATFDSSGNDFASNMDGLEFDPPFAADYHVIARRGTEEMEPRFDLDFADLGAQTAAGYFDILGGVTGAGMTGTGINAVAIQVGYDNSNVAGVGMGSAAADQTAAAAVTTGLELGIALSDLDYNGGPIRVMVGQNNDDHNFWSNQFLAGLPAPQDSVGGDEMGGFTGEGAIDMTNFGGDQFFVVACQSSDICEDSTVHTVPDGGMTTISGSTTGKAIDTSANDCVTSISAPGVWFTVTGTGNTMSASTCNADGGMATYDTKLTLYCGDCPVPPTSDCCTDHMAPGCDDATCEGVVCGDDPSCCMEDWDGNCAAFARTFCEACSGGTTCITGNDDVDCNPQFRSRVTWCSVLGAEYRILVHGFSGQTGDFTMALSDDGTECIGAVECEVPPGNLCPPGSFSATGAPPCDACAAGTAQPESGQTACVPCAPGTAQGSSGQLGCEECVGGTFQPDAGAAECRACPSGQIAPAGATSCTGTIPAVSFNGLYLAVLMLIGVGVFGLRRAALR